MAFELVCKHCMRTHLIDDTMAGKIGKCACGERITLTPNNKPAPVAHADVGSLSDRITLPMDLAGSPVKLPLGIIRTGFGTLSFECEINSGRTVSLTLLATSDMARSKPVHLSLNEKQFVELKKMLAKVEQVYQSVRTIG